jgi:hypothetical protein
MITVAFSTNQVVGAPQNIVLVDSSSGTDVTAVNRRVYLVNAAGEYITESGTTTTVAYTEWPLVDGATLTLDVLSVDAALNITLSYVTAGGAVANGATLTSLNGFTLFNESFLYTLTQAQSSDPSILQDTNYYANKSKLRENIDSGNQAITLADDIQSAQQCYDLATYLVTNQAEFF